MRRAWAPGLEAFEQMGAILAGVPVGVGDGVAVGSTGEVSADPAGVAIGVADGVAVDALAVRASSVGVLSVADCGVANSVAPGDGGVAKTGWSPLHAAMAAIVSRHGNQAYRARNRATFIRQRHHLPFGAGPLYAPTLLN